MHVYLYKFIKSYMPSTSAPKYARIIYSVQIYTKIYVFIFKYALMYVSKYKPSSSVDKPCVEMILCMHKCIYM